MKKFQSNEEINYYGVFRLVFVMFSLYLTGDVIYRWSGVQYYSTFTEFYPSIALITVLWSIIAAVSAVLLWFFLKVSGYFMKLVGHEIRINNLLIFTFSLIFMGTLVWVIKRFLWTRYQTSFQLEILLFLSITVISILLTWLCRNRATRWIYFVQERFTPLVWLYCICFMISALLVTYNMFFKQHDVVQPVKTTIASAMEKKRPNIILVTFDALNAEDMSLYGYYRQTTPFIDKWSSTASVFTNIKAGSNWTSPALASLMTGKRVWTHRLFNIGAYHPHKSDVENLPLILKKYGYYNMALITNHYASVDTLGIANSFDLAFPVIEFSEPRHLFGTRTGYVEVWMYKIFGKKFKYYNWIVAEDFIFSKLMNRIFIPIFELSQTEVPPHIAFDRFIGVIDGQIPSPFFAWIHLYPPHDPFLPPPPYMGMFDSSPELRTFKSLEKLRAKVSYKGYITEEAKPAVDIARARYDEFIRFCDDEFKNFIARLSKRSILKNTLIILSSDHGESFEHGKYQHGGPHLYEQLTHIPLIVKEPGQKEGKLIDDLAGHIDISSTILDLVDIQVPPWMEGRSLKPLLNGDELQSTPVFSMNFQNNPSLEHKIINGTISVWKDKYKLTYYIEKNKVQLFNLREDPDEMENIFDEAPETGRKLLELIKSRLENADKHYRD